MADTKFPSASSAAEHMRIVGGNRERTILVLTKNKP